MASPNRVHKEATVSLRDAKALLSSLTKQARAGTRVIITNHGTPIADLVQHGAGTEDSRSFKRPGPPPEVITLQGVGPTASDLVLMDRQG